MKLVFIIVITALSAGLYGQKNAPKNFAGMHFGGQAIVGYSYDRTLLANNHLRLNVAAGFALNEFRDDADPTDCPINGLNLGLIALYDVKIENVFIETGVFSSPYFYKSLTFINYYGWFGVRTHSKNDKGGFASLGWTPSFHFSKKPPEKYNNVKIGVKIGFNF